MTRIELSGGRVALVDDQDAVLVSGYRWRPLWSRGGYCWYAVSNKNILMHRLIMGLRVGDKTQVDHANREGLDNRRENLRLCTASENRANSRHDPRNKTGYRGVYKTASGKFYSAISVQKKTRVLGTFDSAEKAARAFDAAARERSGRFAVVNFN